MSAKCKYGDEESSEVVACEYDRQTGAIVCPQPHKRAGAPQTLERVEMDVRFINDEGKETKGKLVAKYEDGSDEPLLGDKTSTAARDTQRKREDNAARLRRACGRNLAVTFADVTGEFIGTLFLTLVICSVIAASIVTGAQAGLWQVAIVCGLGVGLSIYCTAHVSDAHLNPAITLAFAIVRWKVFSWKKILPYVTAQMLGGICAGGIVYGIFANAIREFEQEQNITRGQKGSELTAMLFGEYFPNPELFEHNSTTSYRVVSSLEAMLVEAWGTSILAFVIFALTGSENSTVGNGSNKVAVPILIGATVSVIISLYAPLTQAGLNPARDFGPRIVAALAGWGGIAIPGPRRGFWVYIVGPLIGAPLAAAFYDWVVTRAVKLAQRAKSQMKET